MKNVISILLVLLMLLSLAGCGQEAALETQPEPQTTEATEETVPQVETEPEIPLTPEGYFVTELVLADGTKTTEYRNGGPEGPMVRAEYAYPDGATGEETYDAEGNLAYKSYNAPDGSGTEDWYYPNGNTSKHIMYNADGSWAEWHHADDGQFDEQMQIWQLGTVTYNKLVSADGQVEEYHYDIRYEADGSWWQSTTDADGTIYDTRCNAEGNVIEMIMENPVTGARSHRKYYDNGALKYSFEEKEGYKIEMEYDEEGYCILYYFQDPVNTREATIDENGKLIRFTINGADQSVSYWAPQIGCRTS